MTADAFRTEIALMLERLGHTVISSVSDIVTTKDSRKYVTACATSTDQTPTKTPALRRLHDAVIAANGSARFLRDAAPLHTGSRALRRQRSD
jgi:hypothetical protein